MPSLRGDEVPVVLLPLPRFRWRQIQRLRQGLADRRCQPLYYGVQPVREQPGGDVSPAQGTWRLPNRLRQLWHSARRPLALRLSCLDPHCPCQCGLGEALFRDTLRVAHGQYDRGELLPQSRVGVLDRLRLLMKPRLRLQHNPQPFHLRDHVHPPAPDALLVVRLQSLFSE